MKKIFASLVCSLSVACLAACMTANAAPTATATKVTEPKIEIPYGTPTVDGTVSTGEYTHTYTMNKDTAFSWWEDTTVGDFSAVLHFSWDENGLYYAAIVQDATPCFLNSQTEPWVGWDCVELAVNPGNLLPADETTQGLFLTFGAPEDGKIVAYRHNYDQGLISSLITGANTGHRAGSSEYTVEVFIPWAVMQVNADGLDASGWNPQAGSEFSVLPCAIDSQGAGGNENIVTTMKFNGTDFNTGNFLPAVLLSKEASTQASTTPPAQSETLPVATTPATNAPGDTATGCQSALSATAGAGAMLIAVGAVCCRKKKNR